MTKWKTVLATHARPSFAHERQEHLPLLNKSEGGGAPTGATFHDPRHIATGQILGQMPDPLRPDQWRTLVTWAMMFSIVWPLAAYTEDERQRLTAIARAVPTNTRLVLVLVGFILWYPAASLVGFINMLPLAAVIAHSDSSLGASQFAVLVNAGAMLASTMMLGCLIASWAAGRVTFWRLPYGEIGPHENDAALLAKVHRKLVRTAGVVVVITIVAALVAVAVLVI